MNTFARRLMPGLGLIAFLAIVSRLAGAQTVRVPAIKKPVGGGKIPFPTPRPTGPRPIGVRYKIGVRAVIQRVTEPGETDGKYECYGYLRFNKTQRWSIPASEAHNFGRGAGEQLDISGDATHIQGGPFVFTAFNGTKKPTVDLQMALTDADASGQPSHRIAVYLDALDLRKIAASNTEYRCRMGGGDAMLFVKVEQIGSVFGPRLIPTPIPSPSRKPLKFPRISSQR